MVTGRNRIRTNRSAHGSCKLLAHQSHPMILNVQHAVHEAIAAEVRRHFGVSEVPPFSVEVPPNRALGDLAVTIAFQLARALRKPPRAIAQELAGTLTTVPGVARVVATPNGYLNLYLDRAAFLIERVRRAAVVPAPEHE